MGMTWRGIGLAAAALAVMGAGRARADFAAMTSTSGLSQTVVANPAGQPTITYSNDLGFVSTSRTSSPAISEVDKFSLASLAGARITSATLTLRVFVAQPLDPVPFALTVATFGSASSTASPADFQSGIGEFDRASIALITNSTTPYSASLDRTAALQALVDGGASAVGFRFFPSRPGNISFDNLVLNVTYQPGSAAVPEPSSLALGLIAGGIGLAARRRSTRRRAG